MSPTWIDAVFYVEPENPTFSLSELLSFLVQLAKVSLVYKLVLQTGFTNWHRETQKIAFFETFSRVAGALSVRGGSACWGNTSWLTAQLSTVLVGSDSVFRQIAIYKLVLQTGLNLQTELQTDRERSNTVKFLTTSCQQCIQRGEWSMQPVSDSRRNHVTS